MPLYYLHLTEGDEIFPDLEGTDRAGLAAVQRAATDGASGLVGDALMRGEHDYRGRLDVVDADGKTVLTLVFTGSLAVDDSPAG